MPSISPALRTIIWILTGIASTTVPILFALLEKNITFLIRRRGRRPASQPLFLWLAFCLSIVVAITGAAFASSAPDHVYDPMPIINISDSGNTPQPLYDLTKNIPVVTATSTLTQFPTPIPTGATLRNLKFAAVESEYCKGSPFDHLKIWDYDYSNGFEQFFISPKGYFYIIACGYVQKPQESIQISAKVAGDEKAFGYGVILGWGKKEGWSSKNMNFCGFGVRTDGTTTYGKFSETIDGKDSEIPEIPLDWMNLDTKDHTVRMVIQPNREAVGYIDGKYVGEHTFISCNEGEMGFYATGTGSTRILFDDLVVTSLPK